RPDQALARRLFTVFDYGSGAMHTPIEVIGVVEDAMLHTVLERPGPELYYLQPFSPLVIFRYEEAAEGAINQRGREVMASLGGARDVMFLEDLIKQQFVQERRES